MTHSLLQCSGLGCYSFGFDSQEQQPTAASKAQTDENSDDWTPFAAAGSDVKNPKDTNKSSTDSRSNSNTEANPLKDTMNLNKDVPILFLHGVGGLPLYLEMIKYVTALGSPVLAVEYKHVGLRLRY